jgi:hypothetical protein
LASPLHLDVPESIVQVAVPRKSQFSAGRREKGSQFSKAASLDGGGERGRRKASLSGASFREAVSNRQAAGPAGADMHLSC